MPHLLLAVYLLTGLMGRGAFVLCVEGESAPALEFLVQDCCVEIAASGPAEAPAGADSGVLTDEDCPCVDLPADFLLLHRFDFGAAGKDLPALLPCLLPNSALAERSAFPAGQDFPLIADRGRPDLPGAGAAPRVLRN